jgi:hypothetical protein
MSDNVVKRDVECPRCGQQMKVNTLCIKMHDVEDESALLFGKRHEVQAEWWLDRIRSMRCLAPGCDAERSDPHHLCRHRHRDDLAVPLCRLHHRQLHDKGEWAWMVQTGCNLLKYLITSLMPQYEHERRQHGLRKRQG